MSKRLVVIGAGGHGKVVADAAVAVGDWSDIVFLDDRFPVLDSVHVWKVIGKVTDYPALADARTEFVVAIGQCQARLQLSSLLEQSGAVLASVIHPTAVVSPYASVGRGSVVFAKAVINIGAVVGNAVIVNTGAIIEHDCLLADGVHVCPGVALAGAVRVGSKSWIGIGSACKQGIGIGEQAMIGAGAVVVTDIPSGSTAVGVPARIISY